MKLVKVFSSLILVAVMATALALPAAATFVDVPEGHWAKSYIDYAENIGLMHGIGDNKFAPDASLSNAEICQIAYNLSGEKSEVTADPWYRPAVEFVHRQTGLNIEPNETCSRSFACYVVYRLAGKRATSANSSRYFKDIADETYEMKQAIVFCADQGIIGGFEDGTFRPYDSLTRAQAAKIFVTYLGVKTTASGVMEMADFAQNQGLYVEVENAKDARAGYAQQKLLIYTEEGYYTFYYSGDGENNYGWAVLSDGQSEVADDAFVREWIKTIAKEIPEQQKLQTAKTHLFQRLEELDLFPEATLDNGGSSIRFNPFGGVDKANLPGSLSGGNFKAALSISGGALVVNTNIQTTPVKYLETMRANVARLSDGDKASLAAEYLKVLATRGGWKAEISKRTSTSYQVKCYKSAQSSYYLFVPSVNDGRLEWRNDANGKLEAVSLEGIKLALK